MKNWNDDTIATFHKRKNSEIETAVEEGIRMISSLGSDAALNWMTRQGVPTTVARRVVLAPELRRVIKNKEQS